MSKPGMIKAILVADVLDPAKAKANLPTMVDNGRKLPGVINLDVCEMLGDNSKYGLFGLFESEDAFKAFQSNEKIKELREKAKANYKGEWQVKKFKVVY